MTGQQKRHQEDGSWYYLPMVTVVIEAGLEEVETYVSLRHNTTT